jgi:hypothetical protein
MSKACVEELSRIRVTFRMDAAFGVVTTNGAPYLIVPDARL